MITYLDTETPPIARGRLAQEPVCAQWAIDGGEVHLQLWCDVDPEPWFKGTIVGANLAYDMACIAVSRPHLIPAIFRAYDEGRIVDVQLDGKLLDIAAGEYAFRSTRGWNLQELSRRVGVRIEKDSDDETGDGSWRLRFVQLRNVPVHLWPEGAVRYATEEIPATRAVHLAQQEARARWQQQGLDPLGPHSAHAAASAFALHLASCQGVLTDPAAVEAVHARVEAYLDRIRGRLQRAGLVRDNGKRNVRAAQRAMVNACTKAGVEISFTDGAEKKEREAREKLTALELEMAARRPKPPLKAQRDRYERLISGWQFDGCSGVHFDGVQIDKDKAILSRSRVLELYAEYGSADLLRGRVERMRQGYVLPLQTRFDPLKETARTSSTQPSPPLVGEQMQNFPRSSGTTPDERRRERGFKDKAGVYHKPEYFTGLRECFRPRDGHAFIIADISQAEMCTLAEICLKLFGHSRMAELINAGKNLHVYYAAKSLGIAYDAFDKKTMKADYDRAKPSNFGRPGGMGDDKFILYSRKGYNVIFTPDEAAEDKVRWFEAYPEVREYLRWISRQLGGNDTFTHVHPITGFVRGGCWYTSGANHGFQHLCAMGAKLGLYEVTRACFDPRSPLWGCRPVNFVHDEVIAEAPLHVAHDAAIEMGRIMTDAFNRFVPNVPTTAEPLVATRWSKRAEPVYVDGRLVPWTPEMAA